MCGDPDFEIFLQLIKLRPNVVRQFKVGIGQFVRSNFSSPVPDILKKSFVQFDPEIIFAGIRLLFGEPAEPFGYIVLLILIELTDGLNRLDLESLLEFGGKWRLAVAILKEKVAHQISPLASKSSATRSILSLMSSETL